MTSDSDWLRALEDAVTRLINIAQDQTTILTNQQRILEGHTEMIRALTENLEELRRGARHTQRLWVRLAQKNGWLDDEDFA